jgi:hypothetical protein
MTTAATNPRPQPAGASGVGAPRSAGWRGAGVIVAKSTPVAIATSFFHTAYHRRPREVASAH